jgi:hypothetical protein
MLPERPPQISEEVWKQHFDQKLGEKLTELQSKDLARQVEATIAQHADLVPEPTHSEALIMAEKTRRAAAEAGRTTIGLARNPSSPTRAFSTFRTYASY